MQCSYAILWKIPLKLSGTMTWKTHWLVGEGGEQGLLLHDFALVMEEEAKSTNACWWGRDSQHSWAVAKFIPRKSQRCGALMHVVTLNFNPNPKGTQNPCASHAPFSKLQRCPPTRNSRWVKSSLRPLNFCRYRRRHCGASRSRAS